MKTKQTLLAIIFGLCNLWSIAQQDPVYNLYLFNPLVINPAYAGSRDRIQAIALHRSQWLGMKGAPTTQTFSIHAPVWNRKVGLGLTVINDMIGPVGQTYINATYAYRLLLSSGRLSFGLRTGVQNYRFAWEKIDYRDDLEDAVSNQTLNDWNMNFDFGVRYSNRLAFFGVALAHLNNPTLNTVLVDTLNYYSKVARDLTITGGKAFEMSEDLVIRPSFMARANKGVGVLDLNCSFFLKQTLWLGFSASTAKRLVLLAEYYISNNIRAGYSFDTSLTPIRKYSYGSHEIFISIEFGDIPKPAMLSPRVYGYF